LTRWLYLDARALGYMSAVQLNSTPVITCDHPLIPAIVSYRRLFLNLYSVAHGRDLEQR